MSGILGCLVTLGSAIVAVWHYASTNTLTLPARAGAGLGAHVGFDGAILTGLLFLLLVVAGAMSDPAELAIEQMHAQGMANEQIEEVREMVELLGEPLVVLLVGGVFGTMVGAVGGAIGASVFRRNCDTPVGLDF